jgi:hypothetical protein
MRGALRLGIQKTLGVVQSYYRVNLAALATGYIIVDSLDDDTAEAEVNCLDVLVAPAAEILAVAIAVFRFSVAPPPPRRTP